MTKILFFNPPSIRNVYLSTNVSVGAPSYPSLTLATLAGNLINQYDVKIIDLDLLPNFYSSLSSEIKVFKPDIVASSANTPNFFSVRDIMRGIKKECPTIKTIVGGVHISVLPEESVKEDCFDFLAIGEGDKIIPELLSSSSKHVAGIMARNGLSAEKISNAKRELIRDLNELPFPAWQLFPLNKYRNSRLSSRKNPVGLIETSRGCAFQCNFCNKSIFGNEFRAKNPKRVVDEMEHMLKSGFKEIHIIDDSFTQDIGRAKEVCLEIIRRNLKFPWSLFNGIRVDRVDLDFFKLAKQAGCWQVAFGIESGDQNILDKINKKTTLSEIENAVNRAQETGINTFGFFILALLGESEESMRRTIEFACKLHLDIAKFDICIPYPGTAYYKELKSTGRIRTENWSDYICHNIEKPLFDHPNLAWPVIRKYYGKVFRSFYLRPKYITRRFFKSLKMGDQLYDMYYLLKARW